MTLLKLSRRLASSRLLVNAERLNESTTKCSKKRFETCAEPPPPPPLSDQQLLLDKYHQLVKAKILDYDSHQFEIVFRLNHFCTQAVEYEAEHLVTNKNLTNLVRKYLWSKAKEDGEEKIKHPSPKMKSVYLYGGVGCGKTMLMDLVYFHLF